jgi:hypothetical protein
VRHSGLLGMISGVSPHKIATINGQPFADGESHKLSVGPDKLTVQCTRFATNRSWSSSPVTPIRTN